ncbi:aromatic amino acid ammonia-lyase [Streptacidiphilus jiangxiensis]|uniref:Histidine ammonia-lyase n=1 Tax=Streptacidiphilus jiangxiensis TaxID=235985 RepID=A0A1H7G5H4_STRJI|nr:aromatic amino acid ammonia-lyase [Streptacidiphilus jiangxiensis]SEK33378.1 histidine ammonia-lyase [Streptacidiphilus jiangxiensis]
MSSTELCSTVPLAPVPAPAAHSGPAPDRRVLTGRDLTAADVAALARRRVNPTVDPDAREQVRAARDAALRATARKRVYGHTTGVGVNRTTDVPAEAADAFGMNLLRSHSGGIGPVVPDEQARAMLAVRLNQLLGAGSALGLDVVDRIAQALASGHVPAVHAYGAVGTADLSALGELGLTLAGELPWRGGDPDAPVPEPVALTHWDALPLMSSSALTIGQTALAATDLQVLLDRVPLVAALTLTAVRGSVEPYADTVHARRPHPGATRLAARMRGLLAATDWQPALVQDPFGLRCLPQVHGAAMEAADALDRVLGVELNAAAENPLLDAERLDYHHHGGFHQAALALAGDQFRLALLGTAQLSTARLGTLADPAFTGLAPYLAADVQGSSGIMITEYAAQSALAELRSFAQPVTLGHAVLSRGVEEHSSFASTGARRLLDSVEPFRLVLACELLAAVRALRLRDQPPPGPGELRTFFDRASALLAPDPADQQLTAAVQSAAELLSSP